MKYNYNKVQPNIEYGMLSSRSLNNPKRKPDADGLVTYYYTSVEEPLGGTYYRNRDYYIIPVKVTPEVYALLVKRDKKEHNNIHKHDRRFLDVERYYRQRGEIDEDDREINAWERVADKKTLNFENDIIEELDKNALLSIFSKSDRIIVKLYEAGVGQKQIAKAIGKTQSYVSKRLERLLDLIERERLNDGSRAKKEIEFELAWKKFIYSHKMPKDIDVILETFNYLIGERMLEELLIYFYSFGEYYRYAYRLLYLYEYNPEADVLGLINDLPLIFRKIFYYQKLDEQADIFIWLYYCLITEMERRKKITPEPTQAVYEQLIDEQEKTAKRVKMTSEQFMEERFIPKVAPLLKKRNDDFMKANNVYVFDDDADIEAEFKKLFGDPK
ncbi:MAG: hypothetical protein K2K80_08315 [Clostridia bacterium]|nr:hypothetical protein [Clostridia bacterium]